MKKILLLLLLISLSVGVGTVSANAALFGTGAEVIANDVTMIKTGLIGEPLSFCDTDFKSARFGGVQKNYHF